MAEEFLEWRCVPLLVLYCFDILEHKETPTACQVLSLNRPCSWCTLTGEDIIRNDVSGEKSERETNMVTGHFLEIWNNNMGSFEDKSKVAQEQEG